MQRSELPFIDVILPWLEEVHLELKAKAGDRLHRLTAQALASLDLSLLQRWSALCSQSLFNELQIYRMENPFRKGNSSDRYLDFLQKKFLDPRALEIYWNEYPKLQQLVKLYATFWVEATVELLERLEADSCLLSYLFCDHQPLGKVIDVHMDMGDFHHRGRSVCLLTFEWGQSFFYKPKNLDVTQQFHLFLQELTDEGFTPSLQGYRVCPRGEYGWEGKVESFSCNDVQAVERYFQRAGALLALLFLFDGTDMHNENVIASGEFPMLIDVETLFHTRLSGVDLRAEERLIYRSVLESGLLPLVLFQRSLGKGADFSGLGEESQMTISQKKWVHLHTDEMKRICEQIVPSRRSHQVRLGEEIVHACDFVESIVFGFNCMYRFLQDRPSWVHRAMVRMYSVRVRIVLRDTRFYAALLRRLSEVAFYQEGVEETLSLLYQPFYRKHPLPDFVIAEERRALLQGDIPCFHTTPFSTDLYVNERVISSDCILPIPHRVFSEEDRAFQEILIRQAFSLRRQLTKKY